MKELEFNEKELKEKANAVIEVIENGGISMLECSVIFGLVANRLLETAVEHESDRQQTADGFLKAINVAVKEMLEQQTTEKQLES